MSVGASGTRLSVLTKDLSARWAQTKETWADAKSLEFEQRFLNELFSTVNIVVANAIELDRILGKVRKDCE